MNAISCSDASHCVAVGNAGAEVFTTNAGTSWSVPQTLNGGSFLAGASCPSITFCVAVGAAGSILTSTDAGATWTAKASGTTNDLYAVDCPSATTCIAVGATDTITATTNGGAVWTVETTGAASALYGVGCSTPTTCVAVGQNGASPATKTGVAGWSDYIAGTGVTLAAVRCPASNQCFATGVNGSVYEEAPCMPYSSNVEGCWERSSTGVDGVLYAISCPTTLACFAAGDYGTIVQTTSGGTRWQRQSPPNFLGTLLAINCPSTTVCIGVGTLGSVLTTHDGGYSWRPQTSGTTSNLNGVSCASSSLCFAVGDSGAIAETTDGGSTWSVQTSGTTNGLFGVSCPTATTCFAAGGQPGTSTIVATTDGGAHWTTQTAGASSNLTGISCGSTSVCVAVGTYGWSTRTSNGGATWTAQQSSTLYQLAGVTCPSTSSCYAAGGYSTILASTDAGATWSVQMYGSPTGFLQFNAVTCPSTATCFVAESGGGVYATTDSGAHWSSQTTPLSGGYLYGISCASTTLCFSAGGGGRVIGTSDGGATGWHLVAPSGTTGDLVGVSCPSTSLCFAPTGVTIMATANGGAGWFASFSAKYTFFHSIACPSTSVCFAVGSTSAGGGEGPVFVTTNAGASWAPAFVSAGSGYVPGYVSISCPSTTSCFAVASGGTFLKTTDGINWSPPAAVGSATGLSGVSCPTASVCFASDNANPGHLYSSIDGGSSWSVTFNIAADTQAGATGPFTGIDCPTPTTCYATGASGLVATTTDGGQNWRSDFTGSQAMLTGLSCPAAGICDVSANDGTILRTTNFGGTWEIESSGTSGVYTGVSCPTTAACFAVAYGGIISAITSAAPVWTRSAPTSVVQHVLGMSCVGSTTCYAAAQQALLSTHDGGATWVASAVAGTDYVDAISCPLAGTCFAVGWPAAIYRTTNGGTTWTYEASSLSGSDHTLTGVSCATSTTCVAVGDSGIVLSTSNGMTWGSESSGTMRNLWGVSCPSSYSCMAVGDYGLALTRSGGAWSIGPTGIGYYLLATNCPSVSVCYAVGYAGNMIATVDRGASWFPLSSAATTDLNAISCLTTTMCLAAGVGGTAVMTLNAGTWSARPMPTYYDLRTVAFTDLAHAWVGGQGGTILANSTLVPSCSSATLTSDKTSPQSGGTTVTFTAHASGSACSSPIYQYWMWSAASGWVLKQAYSSNAQFVLDTTGWTPGTYTVDVWAEQAGSLFGTSNYETFGLESWVVGGCDSATLSPNPAPTTGTVMFTATAAGIGCNAPQFQWWLWSPSTGWVLKQPYSTTNTWSLNLDTLGNATYTVDVWVKQQASPVSYETWALSSIPKGACGSTTVSATQSSPQSVGGIINLSTSSPGCTTPSFRYWEYPGTQQNWLMLRDYSTTATYDWNTAGYKPGTQSIVVHVRAAGSTAAYDTDGLVSFSLTGCSSATLAASPASPQALGTTVALTASAPGCSTPLYQFWYYLPGTGWVMVRDYTTNPTFNWDSNGLGPGTYAWVVYVKQQGSANAFDSYALFSDSVG